MDHITIILLIIIGIIGLGLLVLWITQDKQDRSNSQEVESAPSLLLPVKKQHKTLQKT